MFKLLLDYSFSLWLTRVLNNIQKLLLKLLKLLRSLRQVNLGTFNHRVLYLRSRLLEARAQSLNHPCKPVVVEKVENAVAAKIGDGEPDRYRLTLCGEFLWDVVVGLPYVSENAKCVDGTPDDSAGEEHGDEEDTVDQLSSTAGHLQFVKEPEAR